MDVSIIIPTYNRLWSLPIAIESCRHTKCTAEIIVVDDGSDDGTWEWLNQQQGLVIVRQEHLGKCWAVNCGYSLARGKYVKFLDSDDLITNGSLDEQFQLAEANLSDIVVSGYHLIDQAGQLLKDQPWIECDDFIAQQLGECDGSHYSAFLFTKEILTDIPHRPDYAFRDDRMLILEVALKHPKVAIYQGFALQHRVHQYDRLQSTTGLRQSAQNFQHLNLYKFITGQLILENQFNERRKVAAATKLWPLAQWIAIYSLNEAVQVAKWGHSLNPNFKIPDKGLRGWLYKYFGFKRTEQLLKIRRTIVKLFK